MVDTGMVKSAAAQAGAAGTTNGAVAQTAAAGTANSTATQAGGSGVVQTSAAQAQALVQRVLGGERRAIARMLTLIDDGDAAVRAVLPQLAAHAGRALVLGVTGVPGSGKSTLLNVLIGQWLERGHKVAVVAIDPSSPISGGAVLGDRIRMGEHATHANAFVRSFSARGALGGLSHATRAAVDCFDAAGFDRIIVETVGTGQSETAIYEMADTRVVVSAPGLGDDVQAIKAGVLEIADILVVSKGDMPLAEITRRELREMLSLRRRAGPDEWRTRVQVVSSLQMSGIDELVQSIEAHAGQTGVGKRLRAAAGPEDRAAPAVAAQARAVPHAPAAPGSVAAAPSASEAASGAAPGAAAPSAEASMGAALDAEGWRARLAGWAARDGYCGLLGLTVLAGGPGQATVSMTVGPGHLNFNGACHGGAIFSLADTAFGLASNSHGQLALGINASATFQLAALEGDRLVAQATEVHRGRRTGIYRIEVMRHGRDGGAPVLISTLTGTVYIKNTPVGNWSGTETAQ